MTGRDRESNLPDDLTSLHKEIDLIQNCISRMAQNSFLIKGWAITLIVITWAILGKESLSSFALLILLIPIIGFWGLDAYFLWVERKYRKMYEWVLDNRLNQKSHESLYDLNPNRFTEAAGSWLNVAFSKTILAFYGCLILVVVLAVLLPTIISFVCWCFP